MIKEKENLYQFKSGIDLAVAKAHEEYSKFRVKQDKLYVSDFDKEFEKSQ